MSALLRALVAPGFLASGPVRSALVAGGLAALVSGIVGCFTVLRGHSFAGEALGDVGATGGSAAFLVGLNPLFGFLAVAIGAAGVIEMIGVERPRERDLATGIVLGGALGLAALLLFLDTTHTSASGAPVTILFGSMFVLDPSLLPLLGALAATALALMAVLWRPLLLLTLAPDLARSRGVRTRLVARGHLLAMAIAISLSALTIGAVLSTALLVGPPAAALRHVRRPLSAAVAACALGVGATWLGILLAYDSYDWPPAGRGWPVSFLVVALVVACYLASTAWPGHERRRPSGTGRGG